MIKINELQDAVYSINGVDKDSIQVNDDFEGYLEIGVQVDDREFDLTEREFSSAINKILGISDDDQFQGASTNRVDAYPDGYAFYEVVFEQIFEEE